jgi:hypothetical protein
VNPQCRAANTAATPRLEGFEISPERLVEGADKFGQIIVGPPRSKFGALRSIPRRRRWWRR